MTALELGQGAIDGAQPEPDDLQLWSVTTIIGVLEKPALVYWSATETARAAVEDADIWQPMAAKSTDAAIDWLSKARFRTPQGARTATQLGEAVHDACEQYALTGQRPDVDDEVRPFLDQFDRWLDEFQPDYQATEITVYSPTYGYAGTADAFLTVDGFRALVDYKTTRKSFDAKGNPTSPYPEQVGLQLAAYRYAEMAAVWRPRRFEKFRRRLYLLSPEEQALAVPVPEVDGGLVLHITPSHCEAWPIRCDEEVHRAFLFTQEAARWCFQTSKTVMGQPLVPPARRGAA